MKTTKMIIGGPNLTTLATFIHGTIDRFCRNVTMKMRAEQEMLLQWRRIHHIHKHIFLGLVFMTACIFILPAEAADTNAQAQASTTTTNKMQTSGSSTDSSFTIKNLQIETDILANRAMQNIAQKIAKRIAATTPTGVTFYDETSYQTAIQYQSVKHYLEIISGEYDDVYEKLSDKRYHALAPSLEDANVALTAAQGIAQSITSIINMMRTDANVEGITVTIDSDAVVASISQELNVEKPTLPIYYTKIFFPVGDVGTSDLQSLIDTINKRRVDIIGLLQNKKANNDVQNTTTSATEAPAAEAAAQENAEQAESMNDNTNGPASLDTANNGDAAVPKESTKEKGGEDKTNKDKSTNQPAALNMQTFVQDLNKTTSDLMNGLYGDGKTAGMMPSLLKAESILKQTAGCDTIYVKVLTAGGNNATKRNLFTAIFTSPKTLHSGGCVISYIQFGNNGSIKTSGEFDGYTGYYQDDVSSLGVMKPNVTLQPPQ